MAYSRWGHSCWYIWWDTSSGDKLENQVLAVDGGSGGPIHLKFMDVFAMVNTQDFKALIHTGLLDSRGMPKEWEHLEGCLREFLHDVRHEHDEDYHRIKLEEHLNWQKYVDLRRERMTQEERDAEDEMLMQRAQEVGADFIQAKLREPSAMRMLMKATKVEEQNDG